MTREQAIKKSIDIWEAVMEIGCKPAYANEYRFKCPLCELYNNQRIWDIDRNLRCLDCPLYDGITRDHGCCETFEKWTTATNSDDQYTYAQAMVYELWRAL